MLRCSIRAATPAEITLDLSDVTTAVNSTGGGAGLTARAWLATVGLGSVGVGAGGAHAATRRLTVRNRIMGGLRGDGVLRRLDEPRVQATRGEELVVVALLDDPALVHH